MNNTITTKNALASSLLKLYTERDTSLPRAQPGEPGVAEPGSRPRSETEGARPAASETHRPGIGRRRPVAASVTGPADRKTGIPMTYTFKLSRRLASNDWRRAALAPLLFLLIACGGGSSTGPSDGNGPAVAGWLTVQLTTPHTDDGAVQLRITGPAIQDVMAESAYDGFGTAAAGVADLVMAGAIATGNVARFQVPDVNRASAYSVSVVAAAQAGTFALRNVAGYRAVIVR